MPQHKSCEKRMRTAKKANLRNRMARSTMRTALRNVLTSNDNETAAPALQKAISVLDKSVKKNIIHKNNAANKKAKLYRHVKSLAK
ncbi:MAG: 30S ribosomal protein S20 [Chitinivibrionales bacterium]|nr:30S ribosomal protein S20 [Chitinivibrionales bacterium]